MSNRSLLEWNEIKLSSALMFHHRKISFHTVYKCIQGKTNSEQQDWQKTLRILQFKESQQSPFLNKRKTTWKNHYMTFEWSRSWLNFSSDINQNSCDGTWIHDRITGQVSAPLLRHPQDWGNKNKIAPRNNYWNSHFLNIYSSTWNSPILNW